MAERDTQETLATLTSAVEQLVLLHQLEQGPSVEQAAEQSRPWPKLRSWIGQNVPWLLGAAAIGFLGWLELRDQWRDHRREAAEFQESSTAAHAQDAAALQEHVVKAEQKAADLENGVVETQVTAIEAMEQIRKEIRVAHPRLEDHAPKESETLQKAMTQARESEARRELFKP